MISSQNAEIIWLIFCGLKRLYFTVLSLLADKMLVKSRHFFATKSFPCHRRLYRPTMANWVAF
jgi:hypothetical protein